MSSDLDARGTGGSSGNGITDAQRGLVTPRSASASKQAGKQDVGAQPAAPGAPLSFSREETERMLQEEIWHLRPQFPTYAVQLIVFDSVFYTNPQYDHANFNFRGTVMQGWELNYFFIGMALAHFSYWQTARSRIYNWNLYQEIRNYIYSLGRGEFDMEHQLNERMWLAARCGFDEEWARINASLQSPRPDQRQMTPPRR